VSYGREDLPFVTKLVAYFKNTLGIKTWFDKDNLLPGVKWEEVIEDEIRQTKVLLLILSREPNERRGYFQKEQNDAMEAAKYVPSGQIFIIPTMLGECDIPRHLRQYHIENLAEEDGLTRLIQSLGIALEKKWEIDEMGVGELRETLEKHLGLDALTSTKLKEMFLKTEELSAQDSINIIQRIANSKDINRLKLLLELSTLDFISFAEIEAFNIAIDAVKKNIISDNLFLQVTQPEKERVSKMGVPGNEILTLQIQTCKYVRYISRKNTEPYKTAQIKLIELLGSSFDQM
jgi:hypothetical protein